MNDHSAGLVTSSCADLLQHYQANDYFFASAEASFLAQGVAGELICNDPSRLHDLPAQAQTLLRQAKRADDAMLIGAIAFGQGRSRLILPQQVQRALGANAMQNTAGKQATLLSSPASNVVNSLPSANQYRRNVALALQHIAAGSMQKVVLARALQVHGEVALRPLLQRLRQANPRAYTFAMALDSKAAGRHFVGASPELLLEKRGHQVFSHPLAGSIPRSADPQEDGRRAENLLRSSKDLREHALVVDAVRQALQPFCRSLHVPNKPSLLATPTMWHLGTHVRGELHDANTSSLSLALALHPTPAVCGHPLRAARDFIAEMEGFERELFAGLVGWCDLHGDGEWAVSLRCAQIDSSCTPPRATLYAGAGVVAGSDPEAEWQETCAKLRTMLLAMGLDGNLAQEQFFKRELQALQVAA